MSKRIVISVRVAEADAEAIDAVRGGLSRVAWAESVIEAALRHTKTAQAKVAKQSETCPPHPKGRVIKGFCYRCGSLVS